MRFGSEYRQPMLFCCTQLPGEGMIASRLARGLLFTPRPASRTNGHRADSTFKEKFRGRIRGDGNSYQVCLKRLTSSWNIGSTTCVLLEHESQPNLNGQLGRSLEAFNHALALSPVYVDVGKLLPRKNEVSFPNPQTIFLVEVHTIGQIVNLRRHVDFHDGRHIVGLGPGASRSKYDSRPLSFRHA